ncbi:MAG: XRE family transcriptional regulator [Bryobacterales bacterium]|nr:XRE family transcriptional regulator [Bryobacterales bacterium]
MNEGGAYRVYCTLFQKTTQATSRRHVDIARIAEYLSKRDWTQAEAARQCGVTQPRMNDLLRGLVSRFSLNALVNIRLRWAAGCEWIWMRRERVPTHR